MIKITFNTPQLIKFKGVVSSYSEIECFATLYLVEYDDRQIWVTQNEMTVIHECEIKSIEIINPS